MKYVVVQEIPGSDFMDCVAICDSEEQAFGEAYLCMSDGVNPEDYYLTIPEDREGEQGAVISRVFRDTEDTDLIVTVLYYESTADRAGGVKDE